MERSGAQGARCTGFSKPGSLTVRLDAPGHVACIDPEDAESGSPGDVFAVLRDSGNHRRQMAELEEGGFARALLRIFRALYRQRIPYVRFDGGLAMLRACRNLTGWGEW